MLTPTGREIERRVLVLAPCRRDAEVTSSLFDKAGLHAQICHNLVELIYEVKRGAGAVLLTEEALAEPEIDQFVDLFAQQPAWSDLAIVLLMHGGVLSTAATQVVQSLGNVTLLERPSPMRSVVSAALTAVRGRMRQYHLREQIEAIRRAEATARELQQQLEITINASDLGTFHCPIPLGPIIWNDRCKAHFWLPPDAEIDFDLFYSRLHPDDRERTRKAVEATVFDNKPYDIEYRSVSPKGEVRWIRATGRTSYDDQGRPFQFNGTTQDITQRKLSEVNLREADRRKDVFLATLAHELRNPLAPIRNSLQLLRLSSDFSPALVPVRDIMERQVDHMVRLIDDLLDVSRIVSGKIELRKERVELASAIPRAIEMIQPMIDSAGHRFHVSLPAVPIILHADAVRISQIIGNLLNNAVKYTPAGGDIWLTAKAIGDQAIISVKDTGAGIPVEMLPRVFEMFTQVDRTLTRSQGGLGIGLTLTKSLIEMHGGRIEAISEGLDKGSEFIVTLPRIADSPHDSQTTSSQTKSHSPLACRRILVVDDAPSAAFILGKLLERIGQQPYIVNNGQAAIERVRVERPDLVISDIAMPHMDGYELARRLRQIPGMEKCILVALTGYGQDSDRQLATEAGFDRHLVKPVSLDSLEQLLESIPHHEPH